MCDGETSLSDVREQAERRAESARARRRGSPAAPRPPRDADGGRGRAATRERYTQIERPPASVWRRPPPPRGCAGAGLGSYNLQVTSKPTSDSLHDSKRQLAIQSETHTHTHKKTQHTFPYNPPSPSPEVRYPNGAMYSGLVLECVCSELQNVEHAWLRLFCGMHGVLAFLRGYERPPRRVSRAALLAP